MAMCSNRLPCQWVPSKLRSSCTKCKVGSRCRPWFNCKARSSSDEEGDEKTQEELIEIFKMQKKQTEVDEFVEKKSKLLKDVAEQAIQEYEKIAADAQKDMDERYSKAMEGIESEVGELEKEMASIRAEIEADERDFAESQKKVAELRSSGFFFKSLFQPLTRSQSVNAPQEQQQGDQQVEAKTDDSSPKNVLFVVLAVLLALTIAEAVSSGEDWYKVGIYSLLLVALLLQIGYSKFSKKHKKDT